MKTKILFVCHGNICRSPMAELIMKDLVHRAGYDALFEIASAATTTEEIGNPVYPPAQRELALHGIGSPRRQARQITMADYSYYDLIVGMDEENMRDLYLLTGGDPQHKVSLLLDHTAPCNTAYHHRDVADPWYTRVFSTTYDDLEQGCRALMMEVMGESDQ